MSNNLIKALVVVLFAGGIITFVFFKSKGADDAEKERTEEVLNEGVDERPGGEEDYQYDYVSEEASPENTQPAEPSTTPQPAPDKQKNKEQPAIDDIIIPSSKSMIVRPDVDTRSWLISDTTDK